MSKKILIGLLTVGLILGLSGLALASNTATVTQSSHPDNEVYVSQIHNGVGYGPFIIDITQTAGTWNYANAKQKGTAQTTTIWQSATGSNTSYTEQGTPGHSGDYYGYYLYIDVHQTATGGNNYANILQRLGVSATGKTHHENFRIRQVGTDNWAEMTNPVTGTNVSNYLAVDQQALGFNIADLYVNYTNNSVVGADGSGNPLVFPDPATQISTGGNNTLYVDQYGFGGGNTAGLYQNAGGDNFADIDQFANSNYNSLGVHQVAGSGGNQLYAYQGGNGTARVVQDAATDNFADIWQGSPNTLVGANSDGTINYGAAATQISSGSYNTLYVDQNGDDNEIGLYQSASSYNYADIDQIGGNNSLGVYQYAPDGYNVVNVTQYGDASATVSQTSIGGYNNLYIFQSAGSSAIVSQTAVSGNNIVSIIQ